MTPRQQELMQLLVSKGLSIKGAAACVGNCSQEVGINLPSKFTLKTDHGSQGICQWRLDRLTALEHFADTAKLAVTDLTTQGLFLVQELRTGYPALNAMLLFPGDRSTANLTANFMKFFERPSFDPAINKLDFRIKQAEICVRDFSPPDNAIGPVIIIGATGTAGGTALVANLGIGNTALAVIATILMACAVVLGVWYANRKRTIPAASAGPTSVDPAIELRSALEEYRLAWEKVVAAKSVLLLNRQAGDELLTQLEKLDGNDK